MQKNLPKTKNSARNQQLTARSASFGRSGIDNSNIFLSAPIALRPDSHIFALLLTEI
jgi:hypothetical protein